MKVRPIFAWFDLWVGLYWDRHKRILYFLPLPMLGLAFQLPAKRLKKLNMRWEDPTNDG